MNKQLIVATALLVGFLCAQEAKPVPLNQRQARPSPEWLTRGVMYQAWLRGFTPEGTLLAEGAEAEAASDGKQVFALDGYGFLVGKRYK